MAHSPQRQKRLQSERGGAAILFALTLPVLLGFAALAVDLARIHLTRVELQNAADAAALGGARSLSDSGGNPYNWSAAGSAALDIARRNVANGAGIQDALIETGYWNIQDPSEGLRAPGTPGVPAAGDVAAVQVTITISRTLNNGPLRLFFAPVLGIAEQDVQGSSVAVIAPPAGGTGLFPFVIGLAMLEHYWDFNTNTPVLQNGVAPTIDLGSVYTFNGVDVLSGQWTTFQSSIANPDVPFMRDLIDNGNTTELSIGDDTYIQPGAKATLYAEVPVGTDVGIFVVNEVATNAFVPVVAIAAFHIDGYNQGGKYITGHFIPAATIPGTNPGTGNGVSYGAYTPPILVK
ncbi:pilus assembly protein TadG-related protein [Pelodictyon luteolum]|nr:pilus assembly protein TadG-related protein [Pelodictyon luteolum]